MTPLLLLMAGIGQTAAGLPALPSQIAPATVADLAGGDEARAIKVGSVAAEHAWLRKHRLQTTQQSLIVRGPRAFDLIKATDSAGGQREVWFDISSFYGRAF